MVEYDIAIIGAGCVGLATAKGVLDQEDLDVAILEKEEELARHQSGRNSGVLHPGFNYPPDSLKAEFAVDGTRRLKAFAAEHDVDCDELGVLVTATSDTDEDNLEILFERAAANGVEVERIHSHDGITAREPHAAGQAGLWCPEAASIDNTGYVHALATVVQDAGADLELDTTVDEVRTDTSKATIATEDGDITATHVVNAAGVYADRFAHQVGVGSEYRIVPFRGEYYNLREDRRHLTRTMIYPTPDPEIPFLGVHFTRRSDGSVIVGPNAVLAPGREAYGRREVNLRELISMAKDGGVWRLLADAKRRRIAVEHLHTSIRKQAFVDAAKTLVPEVTADDLVTGHAGIRAQLVHDDGSLMMNPLVEPGPHSTHVLNAVSPGLTTSLPFGEYVAEQVLNRLTGD